jgi:hypothetical protein
MGKEERRQLADEIGERAKVDLHFFAVVIQGVTCMSPTSGLHGRVCSFLGMPGEPRKWLELFRGGMKSTLGTVASNVQAVVRDPQEHILLIAGVHDLSKMFLRDIKRVVTGRVFKAVYPHLRPVKDQWNITSAAVEVVGEVRQSREPTWGTAGLDVGITGTHWTRITYDDLVIPENVETRDMAQRVTTKFKQLRPLLDTWNAPELICSTPYEAYDLYEWLKRGRRGWFKRLSIPVMGGEKAPEGAWPAAGELAWPEEFPHQRVEELKALDLKMFWSQYMLNPRPVGLRVFQAQNVKYWRRPEDPELPGWESTTQRPVVMDLRDMELYMGWDPSAGVEGGDESAFGVVGVDRFGNFYVVDVVHGLFTLSEQMELFFELQKLYAPYGGIQRTAVEMAGPFASLGGSLNDEMQARGLWYWIEKAQIRNQNKTARVRMVLGPKYQQGRVYHHQFMYNGPFEEQLLDFPGPDDDMVDGVSHGIDAAQMYGGYGAVEEKKTVDHARLGGFGLYPGMKYALTHEQMESGEYDERLEGLRKVVGGVGLIG